MIIHCDNSYIIHNQSKDIINGIMKIVKTFTKENCKKIVPYLSNEASRLNKLFFSVL